MNTTDTKRRNQKRLHKFLILFALLSVLLVAVCWVSLSLVSVPAITYDETVTISLMSTEEVFTEKEYNGWVYLRISGLGHISENLYSDAFCVYDARGEVLSYVDVTNLSGYGIAADGIIHMYGPTSLYLPRFLPLDERRCRPEDHIYIIGYYVGEEPRRISFNSVDETVVDNLGTFTVEVAVQPPPEVKGRP